MPSTAAIVVIAITALIVIITLIVAIVMYEHAQQSANTKAATDATNASKTGGQGPQVPNTGGGGKGNDGSNAGGVAGNVSWTTDGTTLDPYYLAQFPNVRFTPGKGFIMPLTSITRSPNAGDSNLSDDKEKSIAKLPNSGIINYNDITFDQLMSQVLPNGVSLKSESWDGIHTWLEAFEVPFSLLGFPAQLDTSATRWNPYFMISDIANCVNMRRLKQPDLSTSLIVMQSVGSKQYFDFNSAKRPNEVPGDQILDSVDANRKKYFVDLKCTIALEVKPATIKTAKFEFKKKYDSIGTTIPILIESPAMILVNVFFNLHYQTPKSVSTKDTTSGPSNRNYLFATIAYGGNSYIDVTMTRGYGSKTMNTLETRYPITTANVLCIDQVKMSSTNNPDYLKNTDNYVICLAVPVPYQPKMADLYLEEQIALNPGFVFDMNLP